MSGVVLSMSIGKMRIWEKFNEIVQMLGVEMIPFKQGRHISNQTLKLS